MNKREIKIIQAVIKTDLAIDRLLANPENKKLLDDYNINIGKLRSLMFKFDYKTGINNQLDFNPDVVKMGLCKDEHYLIDSVMGEDYREEIIKKRIKRYGR